MLTTKLWVYLVMSMAYMISAVIACNIIIQRPYSNKPWLIALPSLVLTLALLALMVRDLFA